MMRLQRLFCVAFLAAATVFTSGCTDLIASFFEERSGNVTVVIVNNTPYRASFTIGSYDAFDLNPPGAVQLQQPRIEANSTSSADLTCRRNLAVGTQNLLDRAIATGEDEADGFDPDSFATVVNFSSAPADSDAAALPTVGTAAGREVVLGVDYACGDELIFTFVEDATTAGGFRIDYDLVHATEEN